MPLAQAVNNRRDKFQSKLSATLNRGQCVKRYVVRPLLWKKMALKTVTLHMDFHKSVSTPRCLKTLKKAQNKPNGHILRKPGSHTLFYVRLVYCWCRHEVISILDLVA